MKKQSDILYPLFGLPIALLAGAYLYMAWSYQKIWLFDTVVHENGKYTLLEVMFYFRHFCWEIMGKVVYSLFAVGAFLCYGNLKSNVNIKSGEKVPAFLIIFSGLFVIMLVGIAIFMSSNKFGIEETMNGLLQHRISEIKPLDYGAHWRNHFLSNIVLFSATAFSILFYRIVLCGNGWEKRRFSGLFVISIVLFAAISVIYGFTKDPFVTASYLGHQLREIVGTDLPVTMLLAIGVLIFFENRYDSSESSDIPMNDSGEKSYIDMILWIVPVIVITGFLVIKVMSLNVSGEIAKLGGAKNWSPLDLFAWHFYEHFLDYILVVSSVTFLYLFSLKLGAKNN